MPEQIKSPIRPYPAMVAAAAAEDDAMPEVSPMTYHAQARSQQRAISHQTIEVILDFGRETQSFDNRRLFFMDKKARRRACEALGPAAYAKIEARLDVAIVIGDRDWVITCMHRKGRRIRRAA